MRQDKLKTRLQVAALLADQTQRMTQHQMAEVLGISRATVQRAIQDIKEEVTEAHEKSIDYQRQLGKHLPIAKRVEKYKELVNGDHKPTALKALIRVDHLDGIVTRKEAAEKEKPPTPGPAFILPAGTQVSISAAPEDPPEQITVEAELLEE